MRVRRVQHEVPTDDAHHGFRPRVSDSHHARPGAQEFARAPAPRLQVTRDDERRRTSEQKYVTFAQLLGRAALHHEQTFTFDHDSELHRRVAIERETPSTVRMHFGGEHCFRPQQPEHIDERVSKFGRHF